MNIAFWSEEDGCGTTSGMAAVASVCSDAWNMRTVLIQSRNQEGDLHQKLGTAPVAGMVREESQNTMLDGLDYLLWQARNRKLTRAMVADSMVSVVKGRMSYLPQGMHRVPRVCQAALKESMWQVIRRAEMLSDITFIDCGSGEDELSAYILSKADAVVVCISQEKQNLDAYFRKRHAFRGKVIYLVNLYQAESIYNKKNLNRLYRIGEDELAVIPRNPVFRHASEKGKAERFIRRRIRCITLDQQFYFMQELMQATNLILKAVGVAEAW